MNCQKFGSNLMNRMKRSKLYCPEVVMPSCTVDPQATTTPYSDATQTKKHPPNHIKRPMNAFMVWSMLHRRNIIANNPDAHNATISKNLGQLWATLTAAEKHPFKEEAKRLKYYHKLEYPEYIFKPKPRQRKAQGTDIELQTIPAGRFDSTPELQTIPGGRFDPAPEVQTIPAGKFHSTPELQSIPAGRFHPTPEVRVDIQFSFQTKTQKNETYNVIREMKANSRNAERKTWIDTTTTARKEDVESRSIAKIGKDDIDTSYKEDYFPSTSLEKGQKERCLSTRTRPSVSCTQCMPPKAGMRTVNCMASLVPLDLMSHKQQPTIHSGTPWQTYAELLPQSKDPELRQLWQQGPVNQYDLRGGRQDYSYRTYFTKGGTTWKNEETQNAAKYQRDYSSKGALSMGHQGDSLSSNTSSHSHNNRIHWTNNLSINEEEYLDNSSFCQMRNRYRRSRSTKTQNYKANLDEWETSNYKDDGDQLKTYSDVLDTPPHFNQFSHLEFGQYQTGHMEKAYNKTDHMENTFQQTEDMENVFHENNHIKNFFHHTEDMKNDLPQTDNMEDAYDDTNNVNKVYDQIDNMENVYDQTDNDIYQTNKMENAFYQTDLENTFDQTDDMKHVYDPTDDLENTFDQTNNIEEAHDQHYYQSEHLENGFYQVNDMENVFYQTDDIEASYGQVRDTKKVCHEADEMIKGCYQKDDMEEVYNQNDDTENTYDQTDVVQNSLLQPSNTFMDTFSSLNIIRTTRINSRFHKTQF